MNAIDVELGRFGLDARSPRFALNFPSILWPEARDFARSNSVLSLGRLAQVLAGAHSFVAQKLEPVDGTVVMRTGDIDGQQVTGSISGILSALFVICPSLVDIDLGKREISAERHEFDPAHDFDHLSHPTGAPKIAYMESLRVHKEVGAIFAKMLSLAGYECLLQNMVGLFKFVDEGGDAGDARIGLSPEVYDQRGALLKLIGEGTLTLSQIGPDFSEAQKVHRVDTRLPAQLAYITQHISKRPRSTI